ncbi:MAG TPA: TonB-dependent receptor [Bacteroidota bacterium]|nr:TonB-dependent receptor [Bacteroidota bacterium]
MRYLLHLVGAATILCGTLVAGTTGKITGTVSEKGRGDPLAGANVAVLTTSHGAATGVDGKYFILNVPPGDYDLRVSLIGYTPTVVKNVHVEIDRTTTIDIQLAASAVDMEEIVVQAVPPPFQRDATASVAVVSSEQIAQLPAKDFADVLALQAGVAGSGSTLYIRGGRSNEVAYLIDGMYVKDPVLGARGTTIHNEAISELQLMSGTFNAEYGGAMSGVVNIVTKEGGKSFAGFLEGRTSDFFVKPFSNYHENRVTGSLSGPLVGEDLAFYLSGEQDKSGSWLPFGSDKTISLIGKISGRPIAPLKTTLTWRYTSDEDRPYNHQWDYIPDQYLRDREYSRQAILGITHTVSPTLFYDLRVSYFSQSYYSGVDKDTSQYILPGAYQYVSSAGNGHEFYALEDPIELTKNATVTLDAKGDATWQADTWDEIRGGFEIKRHTLDYFDVYDPKRVNPYITAFRKKPVEGSAYLQDQISLSALVVNLGLRYDYANQRSPYRSNPLDPSSIVQSSPKQQWSPRLGVAHPISDRTSLHFSYGRFFQNPDYVRLFENSQYDIAVKDILFGSPDLDPERTTAYEVGVSHQFTDALSGSFTAAYKDVVGLVGTQFFYPYANGRYVGYTIYVNEAYANIKSFEVRLNMRRVGYVGGMLTYTYSVAKGSASSEQEDYPGTTTSTLLYPLDWDRTHMLNINVIVGIPDNEGPDIFGAHPLENTTWDILLKAASGDPYTPTARRSNYIPKNSGRMPGTFSIDLEASKEWKVSPVSLELFCEILNLTNAKNVVYVWTDTGEPDVTYDGGHSLQYMQDPSNYGPPRRMRLGARIRF